MSLEAGLSRRLSRRLAAALPAALIAAAGAHWWRGYPWLLAVATGIAVGTLVFVTLRTVDRLRDLRR